MLIKGFSLYGVELSRGSLTKSGAQEIYLQGREAIWTVLLQN